MLSFGFIGSSDGTKPLHKQCWLKLCNQLRDISREMLMNFICKMCLESYTLNLNMWEKNYSNSTQSIWWLLMPWLLALPGQQHPWCWLYRKSKFLASHKTAAWTWLILSCQIQTTGHVYPIYIYIFCQYKWKYHERKMHTINLVIYSL